MSQSLFGIEEGIICHQVNCRNVIGGGLSGAIIKAFPKVEQNYHKLFEMGYTPEKLYGLKTVNPVTESLSICNLYTQLDYGNPSVTGKQYTNVEYLINAVKNVAIDNPDKKVYIPYNIGCGLGGADWKDVFARIQNLNCPNLYLIDTLHEKNIPFSEATNETFVPKPKKKFESTPFMDIKFEPDMLELFKKECRDYLATNLSDKTVTVYQKEHYVSIVGLKQDGHHLDNVHIDYSYNEILEKFTSLAEKKQIKFQSMDALKEIIKDRFRITSSLEFLLECMKHFGYDNIRLMNDYNLKMFKGDIGIQLDVRDKTLRYTKTFHDNVGRTFVERSLVQDAPDILKISGFQNMSDLSDALYLDLIEKDKQIKSIKGVELEPELEERA